MIENFLTMPDAPNYEITSRGVCRNKNTGQVLKLVNGSHGSKYYSLHVTGQRTCIKRSPKLLRMQAVTATWAKEEFIPIPSLDYKYEISQHGIVRNAQTGRILKLKLGGKCVNLRDGNGKYISRSVADMLWEAHGKIKARRFRKQPCSCENQHGKHFFPHMAACARFLLTLRSD